jgi:hypothetical protein
MSFEREGRVSVSCETLEAEASGGETEFLKRAISAVKFVQ